MSRLVSYPCLFFLGSLCGWAQLYTPPQTYTMAVLDGYVVKDTAHNRNIPILIRYPVGATGQLPMILWSHGGGPQVNGKDSAEQWGTVLSRAGYIVIHISHLPRTAAGPIDLGPATDRVYLTLDGTGIRRQGSHSGPSALAGGVTAEVTYAGPQAVYPGLDQVNVLLPRSLAGKGGCARRASIRRVVDECGRVNIR